MEAIARLWTTKTQRLHALKAFKRYLSTIPDIRSLAMEEQGAVILFFSTRLIAYLKVIYTFPEPNVPLPQLLSAMHAAIQTPGGSLLLKPFVERGCCHCLLEVLVCDFTDVDEGRVPPPDVVNQAKAASLQTLHATALQNIAMRDFVCMDKGMANIMASIESLEDPAHLDIYRRVVLDLGVNNPTHIVTIHRWLYSIVPGGSTQAKVMALEILRVLFQSHPVLRRPDDEDCICGTVPDPLPSASSVRPVMCALFSAELDVQLSLGPTVLALCRFAPVVPLVTAILLEILDPGSTPAMSDYHRPDMAAVLTVPPQSVTALTVKSNALRLLLTILQADVVPCSATAPSLPRESAMSALIASGAINVCCAHLVSDQRKDALAVSMRKNAIPAVRMMLQARPTVAHSIAKFLAAAGLDDGVVTKVIDGVPFEQLSRDDIEGLAALPDGSFSMEDAEQLATPRATIERVEQTQTQESRSECERTLDSSLFSSEDETGEETEEAGEEGNKMRYTEYMQANPFRSFDQIMDRATDAADPLAMGQVGTMEREAIESEDGGDDFAQNLDDLLASSVQNKIKMPGSMNIRNPRPYQTRNLDEFSYFSQLNKRDG
ncbi:hypothetical protein J8273_8350 [Carpediemonas membranifera]|uniref:Uncharacterized protein n=1 Tax=Carpediemonas membranifera TaxID=201153 RepID=A0A8J6E753_9EUKA|nr:hypothetical protein J8273_8350 [Carpediemonas membranifera]|eukprot:KAG9390310.1 hypothetical protein J8273_8350 [Carpediemonas membranifera]